MVVNIAKITPFPSEKNPFRKTGGQKGRGSGGRNFCPPPFLGGGWVWVAKGDAQVSQSFVQKSSHFVQ